MLRADGTELRLDNVWTTDRTFPATGRPTYENILHFLDYSATGAATNYTVIYTPGGPTITDIIDVTPDPRSTPINAITVEFSEAINPSTFNFADLSLTRNDSANLLTSAVTVTPLSATRYQITGLTDLTSTEGSYQLTVNASDITDLSGKVGTGSLSETWINLATATGDTTPPIVTDILDLQTKPRNTPVSSLDVTLSEAIDLSSFTWQDITLIRNSGTNLITNGVTVSFVNNNTYRINGLNSLTTTEGTYTLTVNGSAIQDTSGNAGTGIQSETWVMDTTPPVALTNLVISDIASSGNPIPGQTRITSTTPNITGELGEAGLQVFFFDPATNQNLGQAAVTGTQFSGTLQLPAAGVRNLEIRVQDAAGNRATTPLNLFVDLTQQIVTPPGITLTQTNGNTTVAEGGITDTYSLALKTQPTADVTIALNIGNQLLTDKATLTFTSSNWNTPQNITVTALNDITPEGAHNGIINHAITSADSNYSSLTLPPLTVAIADNDAEIRGIKWNDLDGDGIQDPTESGLASWTIYLDANTNDQLDTGETFTTTDAIGNYRFTDLRPGTYAVAEVMQEGWRQTFPRINVSTTASAAQFYSPSTPETFPSSTVTATASQLISLNAFRSDPRFTGINGSGFASVIIDTGIDLNHPFFGADANGDGVSDRIVYQYDFADNDADASDRNGHGSHVASIIGSSDSTYTGIAPNANIIALKVFKDNGSGYFSDLEESLQWVINNASTYNIASVNLSLGDERNWSTDAGRYGIGDELAAIAAKGIITTTAAGNNFAKFGSAQGLAYPAADPNAIAVGAVWSTNDQIAGFSQRDAGLLEVFAPGIPIVGANANGGTQTLSGTSQASPHVAGVAVLAQQIAIEKLGRKLTVDEFRTLLTTTGVIINDGDDEVDSVTNTGLNFPRVNMLALAEGILNLTSQAPTQGSQNSGTSSSDAPLYLPNQPLAATHTITLNAGQIATGVDFGNQKIPVPGSLSFSAANFSVDENGTPVTAVTITRTGGSDGAISATLSLNNGTAIAPDDYSNAPIVVTFADGELTKIIPVPIFNDTLYEANETINLTLSNPTGGAAIGAQNTATLAIVNDDALTVLNLLPDLNTAEDAAFSFTIPASTFNAAPSISLNTTATLSNGDPLPAWLSFNPATHTFSGVPTNSNVGTLNVKVTITTSAGTSTSDTFDLAVTNTNDAPIVSTAIVNQTAAKNSPFTFTVPANTFSDIDVGDSLTYSAILSNGAPLPTWLSFNPTTRTFTGIPTPAIGSNFSISVLATDSAGASANDTFDITVLNAAPVLDLNGSALGINLSTTFTEDQGAIALVSNGLTLTDTDSTIVTSATITLSNPLDGNAESLSVFNTFGSINVTYSPASATLQLTGSATLARYQQVLRTLRYNNTSQNPNPTPRIINVVVNDGSTDSAIATSTVSILPINDVPILDLNGAATGINFSTVFTEDKGAVPIISNSFSLIDVDNSSLNSATVRIRNLSNPGAEFLSANTTGTNITATYNAAIGTLELSGSDALTEPVPATLANYQQVLRSVTYNNTSQSPNTTARLIDFSVNDGAANSAIATTIAYVIAINDLPAIEATGNPVTYTENGSGVLVDRGIRLSDADHPTLQRATVRISNFVSGQDTLSFTPRGTITGSFNSGVLTLTGNASLEDYQTVLRSVTYRNSSDRPTTTPRTIEFMINDGQSNSLITKSTIDIAAVNDAPLLRASGVRSLTAISEDPTINPGTLVSTLLNNMSSDLDAGASQGIAVTHATGTGTWQYSTDSGNSWFSFNSVSETSALLLTPNTQVRFSPELNFNRIANLSYRAWDQTSDIAGGQADTSSNGGITAFSTAIATSSLTINPVNDAPINRVPTAQTIDEETVLIFSSATGNAITINDVDAGNNPLRISLSTRNGALNLGSSSGLGTISGNGTANLTVTGTLANLNTALNGLQFTPTANFDGNTTLTINTNDLGYSGSGGALNDIDTIAIAINPINDAPVNNLPTSPQSVFQGASLIFSNSNRISISDVDAGSSFERVTLAVTHGRLNISNAIDISELSGNNTNNLSLQGGLAGLNTALNSLRFTPDAQAVIAGVVNLTIISSELGSSGSGGAKTDTDTLTIAIKPANPILGTASANTLTGSSLNNFIQGFEGDDIINGNGGQDIILGGAGNDTIRTGTGNDFVDGGLGNDTIYLGGGQDTIVLAKDNGFDTIYNYSAGSTRFKLDAGLTFNDLNIIQAGSNTLIRTTAGDQIASLMGTQTNNITANSFI